MKVFRVVTERDGDTIKEPGKVSTEIVRMDYRYAAVSIQRVWEEIPKILLHDDVLIAILEEHPAITVLEATQ